MSRFRPFLSLTALVVLALTLQSGAAASPGGQDGSEPRHGPSSSGDPRQVNGTDDNGKSQGKDKKTEQTPTQGNDPKPADEPDWPKSSEEQKQPVGQGNGSQGNGSGGTGGTGGSAGQGGGAVPQPDKTFTVEPAEGEVKVKRNKNAAFTPFTEAGTLPFGATVDAGNGFARLVAATATPGQTQSATFFDGVFKVMQSHAEGLPHTVLRLVGGDFGVCGPAAAGDVSASAVSRKHSIRRLWGRGKGRFLTRGRYSSASVRGTTWLTEDRCDGTLTRVKRGVVRVCDFAKRRYVTVRAGRSYLAKRRVGTPAPPLGERLCRARAS